MSDPAPEAAASSERTRAGWRRLVTEDGSATLVDPEGRTCHSLAGAWSQARERYVAGVGLTDRASGGVVRLLDVGTGFGLNLAAALEACEAAGLALEIVALESARAPLDSAVRAPEPAAGEAHRAVAAALAEALALREQGAPDPVVRLGERSSLRLLLGDARATLSALDPAWRCDAVFLDPFAPADDPVLWELAFLRLVAERMDPGARLATYCAAVAPRAALVAAGLQVGRLGRVGHKSEGTVAARGGADLEPLPPRLARRLERRAAALLASGEFGDSPGPRVAEQPDAPGSAGSPPAQGV